MKELIRLKRLLESANRDFKEGLAAIRAGDNRNAKRLLNSTIDKLKASESIIRSLPSVMGSARNLSAQDKLIYAALTQSIRLEIRRLKEAMAKLKKNP